MINDNNTPTASDGWIKAVRSETTTELILANPMAYVLATMIAHRARWRDGFNHHCLQIGEAFLGDHKDYGMSRQQYRTAMRQLQEWGFATFRATPRGTIAKLTDTRLYITSDIEINPPANQQPTTASGGWIKAMRSETPTELISANPMAFVLATLIAHRARWHDNGFNHHCLQIGEAFLGDHEDYGMSRQQYRTAMSQLQEWGFATFRATARGTIAKLKDTRLYITPDVEINQPANPQPTTPPTANPQPANLPATNEQPSSNQQPTIEQPLTKNYKNYKNYKKERREEVGANESRPAAKATACDEDWMKELQATEAYKDIDVPREYSRMCVWCSINKKQPSRRRFVNWLNRCDKPMSAKPADGSSQAQALTPRKPFISELKTQADALRVLIDKHVCNRESLRHDPNASEAQWDEYRQLKAKLASVLKAIAEA